MASFLSRHLSIVKPLVQRETGHSMNIVRVASTTFSQANAENTQLPSRSFDLVTVMYAFHEAPSRGRQNILKEAHRLLQPGGTLAVIDICTDYIPSKSMLAGEPYGKTFVISGVHELRFHANVLHSFRISEEYPQAASNIPRICRSYVQDHCPEPCWNVGDETCSDVVRFSHAICIL